MAVLAIFQHSHSGRSTLLSNTHKNTHRASQLPLVAHTQQPTWQSMATGPPGNSQKAATKRFTKSATTAQAPSCRRHSACPALSIRGQKHQYPVLHMQAYNSLRQEMLPIHTPEHNMPLLQQNTPCCMTKAMAGIWITAIYRAIVVMALSAATVSALRCCCLRFGQSRLM